LPRRRILLLNFFASVSRFFAYELGVRGVTDPDGNSQVPAQAVLPVVPDFTEPAGGVVLGTVRDGNGNPLPGAPVELREWFEDDFLGFPIQIVLEGHNSAASGTLSAVTGPAELFGFSNGDVSGRPTASEPVWADEVAYYRLALSDQEIAAHYNAGVNGCAPATTPVPTPTDTPANP
jgi:hypothetical protein